MIDDVFEKDGVKTGLRRIRRCNGDDGLKPLLISSAFFVSLL
jgi:hypothetical protein